MKFIVEPFGTRSACPKYCQFKSCKTLLPIIAPWPEQ
jgi:hypothetical protein